MAGHETVSAWIALWLCNAVLIIFILLRLVLRKWRRQPFTMGDYWTLVALAFNGLRMVGDYYANQYGTPLSISILREKVAPQGDKNKGLELTAQDRGNLVLAGKLMVASRMATVMVAWSLKMAVMDMLRAFLDKHRIEWLSLYLMYTILGGTLLASILSAFLECQELSLNWKLFPDPEKCSNGVLWSITYEISNTLTDVMLFSLLIVLILTVRMTKWGPIRLCIIVLSLILIAINAIRLVAELPLTEIHLDRTIWESVEVAIAASVATTPIIFVLLLRKDEDGNEHRAKTHRSTRGPTTTLTDSNENDQEWQLLQNPRARDSEFTLDSSVPTEMDGHSHGPNPMPPPSVRSSINTPMLPESGSRDSWARPRLPFRDSLRNSRPFSRISNINDIPGWFELDDFNTRESYEGVASPELDDSEYGSEDVLVATQINQEVHQMWDIEERPQIVTIRSRRNPEPRRS
ncbi:hypothetical protein GGS21DRAFT_488443 [Xylaria nigripes]|nr:hypothetical protein GGS21DRAFT_488443 [Xylaria nigripes]